MRHARTERTSPERDAPAPAPAPPVPAAGMAGAEAVLDLQRRLGNSAVSRLMTGTRALQRLPVLDAPAERELDAKWNVDTSGIPPALADQLLAKQSLQITIYEAYETGLKNDDEFVYSATEFAKTYQTLGMRPAAGGAAIAVGVPIAVRERGDLAQTIQSIHRTMHRLAESRSGQGAGPVATPLIETVAIFAHGIRKGIGLDPEGEKGSHWFGIPQIKSFVEATRGCLAGNVRFLLFACSAGASEHESEAMPAPDATGGEGSFAAALAKELGGKATVFAHNLAKHNASNPYARRFTADSGTGREMFEVLYGPAFVKDEVGRLRGEQAGAVTGISDGKLAEHLRAAMWSHYDDAVQTDFFRINTKSRHFKAGGYGGIGAAMFMDPDGTSKLLREDFRTFWLTPQRIAGFPRDAPAGAGAGAP